MSRIVNICLVVRLFCFNIKISGSPPNVCCDEMVMKLSARSSLVNGSHCLIGQAEALAGKNGRGRETRLRAN